MDLKHYPRRHYEIDQFTQPHCTELKGSKFYFVMDDGRDFELNFTGEDTLNGTGPVKTKESQVPVPQGRRYHLFGGL